MVKAHVESPGRIIQNTRHHTPVIRVLFRRRSSGPANVVKDIATGIGEDYICRHVLGVSNCMEAIHHFGGHGE